MGAFSRPWKPFSLSFQAFPDDCTRPDDGRVLTGFTSPCSTLRIMTRGWFVFRRLFRQQTVPARQQTLQRRWDVLED